MLRAGEPQEEYLLSLIKLMEFVEGEFVERVAARWSVSRGLDYALFYNIFPTV